jgi:hypothetical protein
VAAAAVVPGVLLAAVATVAWVGAGLIDVSAPLARPAWQPSAVTAVYGTALLLLQLGLRCGAAAACRCRPGWRCGSGSPCSPGRSRSATRCWPRGCPTASATGVVLGAFVLLAAAIVGGPPLRPGRRRHARQGDDRQALTPP